MGMGGGEGAEMKMGTFVIAAPRNALVEVAPDGSGSASANTLTVKRVIAPVDGWVVVRSAGATGGVVGRAPVKRGESRDVVVKIANPDAPNMRVALHVDGGTRGTFEFDSSGVRRFPDRPVFALRAPVEEAVIADVFGFKPVFNSALIKVDDQRVSEGSLTVNYLLLPESSWVVVNLVGDDGLPGERIGAISRPPGESQQIKVPLSRKVTDGDVVVTAFVDKGVPVRFEYEPSRPFSSPDRQYVSAGVTVSQRISAQ